MAPPGPVLHPKCGKEIDLLLPSIFFDFEILLSQVVD
jgi:hypothetical protein